MAITTSIPSFLDAQLEALQQEHQLELLRLRHELEELRHREAMRAKQPRFWSRRRPRGR